MQGKYRSGNCHIVVIQWSYDSNTSDFFTFASAAADLRDIEILLYALSVRRDGFARY